jgi:tetratricopeptide (TPR) repeat protein
MPEFQNKRPLSKKRIFIFRTISILVPFIIIFLIEIFLRTIHYGNNLDLFIESPGNKDFLIFNPDASKRYFTDQTIATTGNIEPFKKEKDTNTCRIFVLGESTTIGYPYFHNGSFHRWLQFRLMNSFPDRKFEVINLSLTAVNSYTTLGFAKDIVDYQPDAVLIYTGHNEYYGVLGVASTDNISGNPRIIQMILTLRQFRLVQLLNNMYDKLLNVFRKDQKTKSGTRMELMVRDQKIPFESDLYKRGVAQFRSNMDQVFQIFNHHQISVFVSSLVSNEKDLKPFISIEPDSARYPAFKKNFNSGMLAFKNKDINSAKSILTEANRIYSSYALCHFILGRIAYQQGQYDSAKIYFERARDLDGLRFRAPGEFNKIIEETASKYPSVHMVNTKALFEANSANHIMGNELILEHVHPNLDGYAFMSDAFYEAMKKNQFFVPDSANEMTFSKLKTDMPVTTVDSLAGIYKINNLKKSWPFSDAMTADSISIVSPEDEMAYALSNKRSSWFGIMDTLYSYYIGGNNFNDARIVVEGLALEHPDDPAYLEKTAMLYGKLNDYEHAAFYFKKAFSQAPTSELAKTLFVIYLKMDKPSEAIPYIDYAAHMQENFNLQNVKKYSEAVIKLKMDYSRDTTNILILNEIGNKYLEMGNKDGAVLYAQKVLRRNPKNKEALLLQQMAGTQ